MKKIFTFVLALCAFAYAAQAQATLILEAHDVWQDGTGYQLLLDADHTAYGDIIPTSGPLYQSDAPASLYAEFEYKIPANADGSLSTSNIVVDDIVSAQIPAGTYDYCITNPTPGQYLWIASGDNARKDDYVFENGKVYHFTMSLNDAGNDQAELVVSGTGVEVIENTIFTVYPNPTSSMITVEGEGVAELYNALGQMVMSDNVNGTAQFNLSDLESGVYFIRMNGVTHRIVKK